MYKLFLFIVIFCIALITNARSNVKETTYSHFQIISKKDTIDFVIVDTSLNVSKPLLLFCQGSQSIPLFIYTEAQNTIPIPLNNFDINYLNQYYHVCVISMPHTPLIVDKIHLNKQYNYITDTSDEHSYSEAFLKADFFENYVERANKVIHFLLKQDWIDAAKLVVAGHSQGARVAVGIASSNKKVTHLGLFGYNPYSRNEQSIRQILKDEALGKITAQEADSLQQEVYEFYKLIQNEDAVKANPSLISWKSFSKPTIDKLVQLKIPVYIAYGSKDIVAENCSLLPLYFIEKHKTNYVLKRYPNLEHNFFPVDENGIVDYEKGEWKIVLNTFIDWTNK